MNQELVKRIDTILSGSEKQDHASLHSHLFKVRNNISADDPDLSELRFVEDILGMYARPEFEKEPFGPMMQNRDRRTFIPEDLHDSDVETLRIIWQNTNNITLKARSAHLFWLICRTPGLMRVDAAKSAIDAYLEVSRICKDHIQEMYDALIMSLGLAKSINSMEHVKRVSNEIKQALDMELLHGHWLFIKFLENLSTIIDERQFCLDKSRELAVSCQVFPHWEFSAQCWLFHAKLCERMNDRIGQTKATRRAGRAYWRWSKHASSAMGRATEIQKAIQTYRRVHVQPKAIDFLKRKLLEVQKLSLSEMGVFSTSIPIPNEQIEAVKEAIKDRHFHVALLRVAMLPILLNPKDIRENVLKQFQSSPIISMFGGSTVDSEGRVISNRPYANIGDTPEKQEVVILNRMMESSKYLIAGNVADTLEPALEQLHDDHFIRSEALVFLVVGNPFIPPDRRELFLRGLVAGLNEDFIVSLHLLIPQLENSLRFILEQRDIVISKHNNEGVQELKGIADCLAEPKIKEILGESILFTLKAVFSDKDGLNIRNIISHGLHDDDEFGGPASAYAWWLILHLTSIPLVQKHPEILRDDYEVTENKE